MLIGSHFAQLISNWRPSYIPKTPVRGNPEPKSCEMVRESSHKLIRRRTSFRMHTKKRASQKLSSTSWYLRRCLKEQFASKSSATALCISSWTWDSDIKRCKTKFRCTFCQQTEITWSTSIQSKSTWKTILNKKSCQYKRLRATEW